MRFIASLIIAATFCTFAIAMNDERYERHVVQPSCNLRILNSSVQVILSSTVNQSNTDRIVTLWDTLDVVVKFLLLNQTGVSQLSFNVTQQVRANVSNLNWSALPADVQSFLLTESLSSIFNLTFSQWAWVNSNNTFANTTLFSLLAPFAQRCSNNASILISPLKFDTPINIDALNRTLLAAFPNLRNSNLVKRFLDAFYESIPQFSIFFPLQRLRLQRQLSVAALLSNLKRQLAASASFQCALKRAKDFLRSVIPIN